MKHFHRTQMLPVDVISAADEFFKMLGMERIGSTSRTRTYSGDLGTLTLSAKKEGGHYTFVEVSTDQMGESRLDRNAKRFFAEVFNTMEPRRQIEAAY